MGRRHIWRLFFRRVRPHESDTSLQTASSSSHAGTTPWFSPQIVVLSLQCLGEISGVGTVVHVRPVGQETRGAFQFNCHAGVCVSPWRLLSRAGLVGGSSWCLSGSGLCLAVLARVSPLFVNCWFGFQFANCVRADMFVLAFWHHGFSWQISFRAVLGIICEGCGLAVSPGKTEHTKAAVWRPFVGFVIREKSNTSEFVKWAASQNGATRWNSFFIELLIVALEQRHVQRRTTLLPATRTSRCNGIPEAQTPSLNALSSLGATLFVRLELFVSEPELPWDNTWTSGPGTLAKSCANWDRTNSSSQSTCVAGKRGAGFDIATSELPYRAPARRDLHVVNLTMGWNGSCARWPLRCRMSPSGQTRQSFKQGRTLPRADLCATVIAK